MSENLWQIENPGFVSGGSTKWFAEKIRSEALMCLSQIQEANHINVSNEDDILERRSHQNRAERALEMVLCIATTMYDRRKIQSKRLKKIATDIAELKGLIQRWRKSDKSRFQANKT